MNGRNLAFERSMAMAWDRARIDRTEYDVEEIRVETCGKFKAKRGVRLVGMSEMDGKDVYGGSSFCVHCNKAEEYHINPVSGMRLIPKYGVQGDMFPETYKPPFIIAMSTNMNAARATMLSGITA